MLSALLVVTLAGTATLQNDNFNGTGTVNSAVSFGEFEGAAVLFAPDAGYPLKIVAIDVLSVGYMGRSAVTAGYQVDVWDERKGPVDPPRQFDGGRYSPVQQYFVSLTPNTSMLNRITVSPPLVLDGGRLFVSFGEQLSTSQDDATIAIDSAALVPGANWYRDMVGGFTRLELPDGGFNRGINHNWIIRAVYETPGTGGGAGGGGGSGGSGGSGGGASGIGGGSGGGSSGTGGGVGGGSGGSGGGTPGALRLDDITPADGFEEDTTRVVLTGDGFQTGAQVLVGPQVLDVVTVKSAAVINADVPPGITPGVYDVTVINLDGNRVKLTLAFTVNMGSRTRGGCGCGSSGLELAVALALAALLRYRPAARSCAGRRLG